MLFAFTFASSFALVELGEQVCAFACRGRFDLGHARHILLLFGEKVALELLELARLLVDFEEPKLVSLTAIFVSKRLVFGVQLANLALQLLQLDHELRQLVCIATATATATTTTGVYDTGGETQK